MTLFFDPAGPLVQYIAGVLHVKDLNPEVATAWKMSRWEMFRMGWRCIRAALVRGIRAQTPQEVNPPGS